MNSLYILNNNIRINNNEALKYASQNDRKTYPIFLDDSKISGEGSASRWWSHQALKVFSRKSEGYRVKTLKTSGEYIARLKDIIIQNNIHEVLIHRIPRMNHEHLIDLMRENLGSYVTVRSFDSNNLLSYEEMKSIDVNFFNFNSFYEKIRKLKFKRMESNDDIPEFGDLNFESDSFHEKWSEKLEKVWKPDMDAGEIFQKFHKSYHNLKLEGNRISPYVSHGQISVRDIWNYTDECKENEERIKRNIAWREFFYLSYLRRPFMNHIEVNEKFRNFAWSDSSQDFLKWRSGRTGFPLIDSAMTQLWMEGWISNELRMVVADFLTKCFLVRWEYGANWFMDTLVDADESVNYPSWQYVGGTGGFSWPFFRIFNPLKKSHEIDPDGKYVKKWNPLPEISDSPDLNNEDKMMTSYREMRKRALETYRKFNNSPQS
jgi:deoxyribodipyrimidine photo-lyase